MPLDATAALADIDAVLNHRPTNGGSAGVLEIATMIKACIERWAPFGSTYRRLADAIDPLQIRPTDADVRLRGVLVTLQRDCRAGMAATLEQFVHASVFGDLIGQADRFLGNGLLWPAAVVIGATLEEHLRNLATKLDVTFEVPDSKGVLRAKAASQLNDDLHQASAYGRAEWQQIQTWIQIRDHAAHGKPAFEKTTEEDLRHMATGVRDLIRRHPA